MDFLTFTLLGIAVALMHIVIPGQHHVGAASAFALGVGGAWGGALFASAFVQGGWANFGWLSLVGSIVGAAGGVVSLELIADAYFRLTPEEAQ
jgi:thiol:disulfide interchange protein